MRMRAAISPDFLGPSDKKLMVEAESSLETSGFAKSVHLLGSLAEVG